MRAMQHTRRLLELMAQLRDPQRGCPWDLRQDFASVAPYTLEEAYEVADAIARRDFDDLRLELGDLLLQVVFHAQMAQEAGLFNFEDVAAGICDKLLRRHPHVFGDAVFETDAERAAAWEAAKAAERAGRGESGSGVLGGVAQALPALRRAQKLQQRAAQVGFDWPDLEPVLDKLDEELAELRQALDQGERAAVADELGDLLFVMANLARHLQVDAEDALRQGNAKFERRFAYIEQALKAAGRRPQDCTLAQLDALWDAAKANGL
jgi:MazG family protein